MYLQRIKIENIRGIGGGGRAIDLDLKRPDGTYSGWTVLAGRNGSGKTTLLQAIAATLAGPRGALSLVPDVSGWVRQGASEGSVELTVAFDSKTDKIEGRGNQPRSPMTFGLRWSADRDQLFPIKTINEDAARRGPWNNRSGWFFAGYGPFRRLSGHSSEAASLMASGGSAPELATLFREDASLAEGVQALREIYLRRMEGDKEAEALERGTLDLLNDGLLPGVQILEVRSDAVHVSVGGARLPLTAISDGYRATAALVLDLLRQMSRFYKNFHISTKNGHPIIPYSGVILLDEADTHLHVSWQQRIGFWLKEHFPHIQFLVTTHSPFICQAADAGGLIRLKPAPDEPAAEPLSVAEYNRVINEGADAAVITSLFGLDSPHSAAAEARREELARLEARELQGLALTREETEQLRALRQQVVGTPSAAVEAALRKLKAVMP